MLNPFGPQREPGLSSYVNLRKKTLQKVQAAGVYDQIFQAVQNAFENAVGKENIVISRTERKRLFAQVLKAILQDMVTKLDQKNLA